MNLLLISCSQRKKNVNSARAIDLYDGPYYQILRKLRRIGEYPTNLDVYIISAKYGLISENTVIEYYDQKMTDKRANELSVPISTLLQEKLTRTHYETIFINLGKTYLLSVADLDKIVPRTTKVIYAKGEIGQRMSSMKRWIQSLIDGEVQK